MVSNNRTALFFTSLTEFAGDVGSVSDIHKSLGNIVSNRIGWQQSV